ncbi:hypothetical protein D4R49_01950 [bacterium]|nr:MAG: hypothetical protein D4R49_01950 [bacterium]
MTRRKSFWSPDDSGEFQKVVAVIRECGPALFFWQKTGEKLSRKQRKDAVRGAYSKGGPLAIYDWS